MKSLRFFVQSVGMSALALAPLALLSSAFGVGFVAVIHRALDAQEVHRDLIVAFVGFGLGRVVAAYFAGTLLGAHAQETITELRRKLIGHLLAVPYRHIERVGAARVHAVLTQDLVTLGYALESTPTILVNGALVLGCAAYLAYLSPLALAGLTALAVPCAAVFYFFSSRARRSLASQRDAHEQLQRHLFALTQGTKELKLHQPRRRSFITDGVLETTEDLLDHDIEARSRFLLGQAINQMLILVLLGAVLFALPLSERAGLPMGYVLVGLYMLGPVTLLARLVPMFQSAEIALERIEELGIVLGRRSAEPDADPGQRASGVSIDLRDVVYRYDDARAFTLGPVSLHIGPGELLFITGGNGSGKSTLARIVTGLYAPSEGELCWDGEPVTAERRDSFRQLWSAVFSELHVFDRLYGLFGLRHEQEARALLARLGLSGITQVENGGGLNPASLSRGQQKRLALMVALLEDRPFYLFDEWAADQDPDFRRVFYRELLPELRARGKGVVVITHDDRYFDCADRTLELRDGHVSESINAPIRAREA